MRNGLVVEVFHRVLFVEPHIQSPMVAAWNARRFLGYHLTQHPQWSVTWNQNQSLNPDDYPLSYSHGLYAWEARVAFLQAAQAHGGLNGWTPAQDRSARQLVGVPAFRCPLGAAKYAENAPVEPLIATFHGAFVWYLPEFEDTGVQAIVLHVPSPPVSLTDFRTAYRIAPPAEADPNLI